MKLKRRVQYRISFLGLAAKWCSAMIGLSVFLRFLYYFMPYNPNGVHVSDWILRIILPTILCVSFGVLLRVAHLRSPGVYGILATGMCLLLMLLDIMDGQVLQIVLSIPTMLIVSICFLATVGGYIPTRSISCFFLTVCFSLRLLVGNGDLTAHLWLNECSELLIIAALFFFTVSLKPDTV